MRKTVLFFLLVSMPMLLSFHKFYVGIYQIEHNVPKDRIEITCRIFADDLDRGLEKKFGRKFHFADGKSEASESAQMQSYVKEKFRVSVNGKASELTFKSSELIDNVLVGYFVISKTGKVKNLKITNTILFEVEDSQQNIIQFKGESGKKNLLLTPDNPSGTLAL